MIQHKGLRVDLVEDEEWLYAFYDHKLPPEIVSGVTLDTWRKKIERENKQFLFLTKEDLTREKGEEYVNEWDFPDHKKVGKLTITLQYRFEPGHDEDGVTAIIPVHQLNQITQTPFDWLVPGMLEEKCVALVKALPKNIRKHFVPVPETVKKCLEIEPDFKGALEEWLGNRLRKLTDEAIPLNAWSFEGNNPADDYFVQSHGVKTPDAFWKVIIRGTGQSEQAITWIVPNSQNAIRKSLDKYLVSVNDIERVTGEKIPVAQYAKDTKPSASWLIPQGCNKG